jgi:hypothetical protein
MNRCGKIAGTVLLLTSLAWAGSTSFISTWKNPNFSQLDVAGRKVAVFVISPDESMRLGPEETLATELRNRGVDCVAGYTVLPAELAKDQEKAKAFLQKVGLTDAILIRVVGKNEELHYMPGTAWYAGPYYQSFWGYWDYGWSSVYSPGYVYSNTVVTIETVMYSVEKGSLMWAGASRTTNPDEDIRKAIKDLANAAGKKMRKDGLLKKK